MASSHLTPHSPSPFLTSLPTGVPEWATIDASRQLAGLPWHPATAPPTRSRAVETSENDGERMFAGRCGVGKKDPEVGRQIYIGEYDADHRVYIYSSRSSLPSETASGVRADPC